MKSPDRRYHGLGLNSDPIYRIWRSMTERCRNKNNKWYGGKGVTVCERWEDFYNFKADMGDKPTFRHSLDRIDPMGNYEPSNCRWATPSEQAKNQTRHLAKFDFRATLNNIGE